MPLERLAVTLELITFLGLSSKEKRPNLKFKELVIRSLQKKEQSQALVDGDKAKDSQRATTLSQFLSSICNEITHQCPYSTPRSPGMENPAKPPKWVDRWIASNVLVSVQSTERRNLCPTGNGGASRDGDFAPLRRERKNF
uniref:Uncharacterized protein n=1 Tax=Coccidioides posadasii RMSCC 3488 TaxID=454284 RepID=A0A0J6FPH2_COCPO|nr:hypothetical protein CPAG_07652 [Coccidioides posadasii RMSCC 3488]